MATVVDTTISAGHTAEDKLVLANLFNDLPQAAAKKTPEHSDKAVKRQLAAVNDENSPHFTPTVFTLFDQAALDRLPAPIKTYLLKPYVAWAQTVVRRKTDVVFLTHIIIYCLTSVPSAVLLYRNFSWTHGVLHWLMAAYHSGPFTLMLHNHNHNGGVLTRRGPWAVFDKLFPYVLEPLMGHTWDSYYNHHVKHHHVEANGPGDLSSTIRYQRDELTHFLHYLGRFLFLVWIELPIYFWTHRKRAMAVRAFLTELSAYAFIVLMARWQLRPTIFVLMLPLLQMRIAMMVGNWGQHALVDEVEPGSDYRSSITVIDIPSNRDCFNDGYHTSHHLNPRRHWRDHPLHMVEQKQRYADEKALVFRDTDYFQMTLRLLMKDYDTLAGKLVPMGKQRDMSRQQLADMLRRKTRRFTEEEIMRKFGKTQ